ncbi:hypothetical protein H6P81_009136 [Aristolochia fimbriata]|uniref:Sulfotransferase n=1 Tax=Aristolochia fimbriata TaxID=158543 RepID=A0AAV7EMR1_ARIFI|nr:hypothetical protein H6P81_009136 [Aristolochia fimbriata]
MGAPLLGSSTSGDIRMSSNSKYMTVQVDEQYCQMSGIRPGESVHVHFPKPETFSRDECICNPVRLFAILSMQRSGSGWFETFLNSHQNVSSNGEIFSVKERRANVSSVLKTLDKVYNLDWQSSAAKNECSAAVGFKWMLNQGVMKYHSDVVDYFNRRGVSAIFLFRKNLLSRMVSILANSHDRDVKMINGTHKSHVHSPNEAKLLAQYKPSINTSTLISDLERAEEMITTTLDYFKGTHHIIVHYEDLVNNRTNKLLEVQHFLRLPQMRLKSRQVKIHTSPLAEHIENWGDVYRTLKGTKYDSFLELKAD